LDHQRLPEGIARQLTQVWATNRTPAFVEYLRQTFGCEPRMPVRFAGIFSLQMIGGYFVPDLPAGPGPVVEGMWLTDDTGFRASSMDEMQSAENPALHKGCDRRILSSLESDNPLVVYDLAHARDEPISAQPYLFVYPKYFFCVRGNELIYIENFGYSAWCTKVGKVVLSDRVQIQNTRITKRMWQGHLVGMEEQAEPGDAPDRGGM
jgi:hypothetical protein